MGSSNPLGAKSLASEVSSEAGCLPTADSGAAALSVRMLSGNCTVAMRRRWMTSQVSPPKPSTTTTSPASTVVSLSRSASKPGS